ALHAVAARAHAPRQRAARVAALLRRVRRAALGREAVAVVVEPVAAFLRRVGRAPALIRTRAPRRAVLLVDRAVAVVVQPVAAALHRRQHLAFARAPPPHPALLHARVRAAAAHPDPERG